MEIHGIIEGILFVVGNEGISFDKLKTLLDVEDYELEQYILDLEKEYSNYNRGFQIEKLGNKYKLITKVEHKKYYEKLVEVEKKDNLSQAALETLAVIAYNEPITRSYIDEIRGVDSSHMVRKLLFRNLIKEVGRSELPGRPILYGVTDDLLDYLGLSSISDLPSIDEVELNDTEKDDLDLYESKFKEDSI